LENNDPTKPREAYFKHVDYIIDRAAELGLYIALLPTWGDKLAKERWGEGPEIFNADNAKTLWQMDWQSLQKSEEYHLGHDGRPQPAP
jgi:hypothetical protein